MNRHYNKFCRRYGLDPFDKDSVYLWEQSLPTYTEDEVEWARMTGSTPNKSIADPAEGIADGLMLIGAFIVILIALA